MKDLDNSNPLPISSVLEISYKLITDEPIVAVASPKFAKAYKKQIDLVQYFQLPHLLCERLHPDKILSHAENQLRVKAKFNDIATTRAACVHGVGWALLPSYAIQMELETKQLVKIHQRTFGKSKYGVWWLRSRTHLRTSCDQISTWLKEKNL